MANPRFTDYFQNFRFHLFDVTATTGLAGLGGNIFALSPQIGFQSITAPSLNVETTEVSPGNQPHPVHIATSATVDSITLSRGVHTGDQEFFDWIQKAIYGRGVYRRDLLLVQYHSPVNNIAEVAGLAGAAQAADTATDVLDAVPGGAAAANAASAAAGTALTAFTGKVFAARSWMLHGVIPVRYKSSGDFDAGSSEVSIQEIEIDVEYFDESVFGPPKEASFLPKDAKKVVG